MGLFEYYELFDFDDVYWEIFEARNTGILHKIHTKIYAANLKQLSETLVISAFRQTLSWRKSDNLFSSEPIFQTLKKCRQPDLAFFIDEL